MVLFDYVFFRSYISAMKTKFKHNAEPRSIALVLFLQTSIAGSLLMIAFKFVGFYDNFEIGRNDSYSLKYLIAIPLVFILWYLNERHYRKVSMNNYAILKRRFKNSIFNKVIPFWVIFLTPFLLLFGIPFLLSLIN